MVTELFGFMAREGETIDQAVERLGITFTNDPNENKAVAAQREKMEVYSATWLQRTAEGMKRFVYLNKRKANAGTIAHEFTHIVAPFLTQNDLKEMARVLNGRMLKDGTAVQFDENTIRPEGLYKPLSPTGNPSFETVLKLLDHLGFRIKVEQNISA
jgi:DNA-binding phage protein